MGDPCANGGTCSLDENYDKHCDCTPTFTGPNCEAAVECAPECVNGICAENHNGKPMCFCQPGYSGIICDRSVCDPNPCFNGGVCSVSHEGKFNCTCPAGFGGDKCEINPCNPDEFTTDCHHGYCEVDQNSGEPDCTCFDGWVDEGQDQCTKNQIPIRIRLLDPIQLLNPIPLLSQIQQLNPHRYQQVPHLLQPLNQMTHVMVRTVTMAHALLMKMTKEYASAIQDGKELIVIRK